MEEEKLQKILRNVLEELRKQTSMINRLGGLTDPLYVIPVGVPVASTLTDEIYE